MKKIELLDINKLQFSQPELCKAAGITMARANNWILTEALPLPDVGSRRIRRPRLFSVISIYKAKVMNNVAEQLGIPPPTAAAIATRTMAKGHNWYPSIPRHVATGNSIPDVFAIIFWSNQCRDWDVWVDLPVDNVLRINLTTIAEKRGEPRLAERPILVLPVGKYFATVCKICQAMLDSSSKRGDV